MIKNIVRIVYDEVAWRRLFGVLMGWGLGLRVAGLIIGHPCNFETACGRVLAMAFGLAFGARMTRWPNIMGGYVSYIDRPVHRAMCGYALVLFILGGAWVYSSTEYLDPCVFFYLSCVWCAGVALGFALGCGQTLNGSDRMSWWLGRDTCVEWTRGTVRLMAVNSIVWWMIDETVYRLNAEHSSVISWRLIAMLAAALVSLCHSWYALPDADLKAERVERGAYRTNALPV